MRFTGITSTTGEVWSRAYIMRLHLFSIFNFLLSSAASCSRFLYICDPIHEPWTYGLTSGTIQNYSLCVHSHTHCWHAQTHTTEKLTYTRLEKFHTLYWNALRRCWNALTQRFSCVVWEHSASVVCVRNFSCVCVWMVILNNFPGSASYESITIHSVL